MSPLPSAVVLSLAIALGTPAPWVAATNRPPAIAQSATLCTVTNLRQGQLALRFTPEGASRAGLDNGNTVQRLRQQGTWAYVRVLRGPNPQVNGLEGWVNANYLNCTTAAPEGESANLCEVANLRSGQLALRFAPNGASRAGLDNGNIVRWLEAQGNWTRVRVLRGPNARVNGLEGWVNSSYLRC